jgi:hypothetical protein
MNGMRNWNAWIQTFLFMAMPDTWLIVLRSGLGLVIVLYALSLRADWIYLFAGTGHGLISRDLGEAILSLEGVLIPRLGWLIVLGSHIGLAEKTVLFLAWLSLVLAGSGLIIGLFCRSSAIVAWFVHLCAAESGGLVAYGVDNFITIGLFYLMLAPLPDRRSVDHIWLGWNLKNGQMIGFYRRVLQVHLCFIYFFGGITKCLGSGWWDGSNIWLALTRQPFNIIPMEVLFRWKYFLPEIGRAHV